MKALHFSTYGPPTVLAIRDIPTPEPNRGEVLIQTQAAAIKMVNPILARMSQGVLEARILAQWTKHGIQPKQRRSERRWESRKLGCLRFDEIKGKPVVPIVNSSP